MSSLAGDAQPVPPEAAHEKPSPLSKEMLEELLDEANNGSRVAQHILGSLALERKEFAVAVEWLRKAADANFRPSQRLMAFLYMSGLGVKHDDAEAQKWIARATEKRPLEKDEELLVELLKSKEVLSASAETLSKLAEAGDAFGQYVLGIQMLEGTRGKTDVAGGLKWLRKAADQNFTMAQFYLATIYQEGRYGVEKDKDAALKLFEAAAENGQATAAMALYAWHINGGHGLEVDYKGAFKWALFAADRFKDSNAEAFVGQCYLEESSTIVPSDFKKGFTYVRRSATQRDPLGMFLLGVSLLNKKLGEFNPEDGERWLAEAEAAGSELARSELAIQYERGDVIPKNLDKARALLVKAAHAGDYGAGWSLRRLNRGTIPAREVCELDARLCAPESAATLEIEALSPDGTALMGQIISVHLRKDRSAGDLLHTILCTDQNGVARIRNVMPDQYELSLYFFAAHSYKKAGAGRPPHVVMVGGGKDRPSGDIDLLAGTSRFRYFVQPEAELSAKVIDASGKPVAKARVSLLPWNGAPREFATATDEGAVDLASSDNEGRIHLYGTPGKHQILVEHDETAALSEPVTLTLEHETVLPEPLRLMPRKAPPPPDIRTGRRLMVKRSAKKNELTDEQKKANSDAFKFLYRIKVHAAGKDVPQHSVTVHFQSGYEFGIRRKGLEELPIADRMEEPIRNVVFEAPGYQTQELVLPADASQWEKLQVELKPLRQMRVTFQAQLPDGKPCPEAWIMLDTENTGEYADESGTLSRVIPVAPTKVSCSWTDAKQRRFHLPDDKPVDFDAAGPIVLTLVPFPSVSGRVKLKDSELSRVRLYLEGGMGMREVPVQPDGTFFSDNLMPAQYTLHAQHPTLCSRFSRFDLKAPGATVDIEFYEPGMLKADFGPTLANARLRLLKRNKDFNRPEDSGGELDALGRGEISDASEGDYLYIAALDNPFRPADVVRASVGRVRIKAGNVSAVGASDPAAATLKGRLKFEEIGGETGGSFFGGDLWLEGPDGTFNIALPDDHENAGCSQRFEIQNLKSGTWRLHWLGRVLDNRSLKSQTRRFISEFKLAKGETLDCGTLIVKAATKQCPKSATKGRSFRLEN